MGFLPLLLLLAVPDDAQTALTELARFGAVPECQLDEQIVETGMVHGHRFSVPKALPALEGQAPVLLPYLAHPNRRVVLRAAELLCHAGGKEAPERVRARATQYPCEPQLLHTASVLTLDRSLDALAEACQPSAPPLLAPARTLGGWPADRGAAKAIAAGDAAALARVLENVEALAPDTARQAAATLSRVDTPRGIIAVLRGVFQLLGAEAKHRTDLLLPGLFAAQLDALAAKTKSTRAAAYCRVVGAAALEDRAMLLALRLNLAPEERTLFSQEADKARRANGLTAFGRADLEELARPQHDRTAWSTRLDRVVAHRDRPALRAFVNDSANGITERLEAAQALALLGEASGLVLWESSEGLWPEERAQRRALLAEASQDAPAEVRAQAEALLARGWAP